MFRKIKLFAWCALLAGLSFWFAKPKLASTPKAAAIVITKTQTACLDPGHGGVDSGAVNGFIQEKDLDLNVALRVRKALNDQGYRVFMTRADDATHTNGDRYSFCNARGATILVSIHQNYFDDTTADYTSALYFKPADQGLAQALSDSTSQKLGLQNSGVTQFEDGVLSKSTMPAALIEGFFMTNDTEARVLARPTNNRLQQEADGITSGIVTYLDSLLPPKSN